MPYHPNVHHRKSIRLKNYDYSQAGYYFITLCTHERLPLFGEIIDGNMLLNEAGEATEKCWLAIPAHFPSVELNEFVIMPNHVHGVVAIVGANNVGEKNGGANIVGANNHLPLQHGTSKTIGSIVRGFKIGVTKWFRTHTDISTVWQRNYYEHIIRNEDAHLKIVEYIRTNPQQWQEDKYYV
jgi:putative transposase